MAKDTHCLDEAHGQTVKVIAQLLPHLPVENKYKVVFMERPMEEVLKSQQIMLDQEQGYPLYLDVAYKSQLKKVKAWLEVQPNIEVKFVSYSEVLDAPDNNCAEIKNFIGTELNVTAMCQCIDPALHRVENPHW